MAPRADVTTARGSAAGNFDAPPAGKGKARHRPRQAATFEAYYWEPYNAIVRPERFDWYLVTRWMADLGPAGFCIVKVLRNHCYHNPKTGITRDTCELSLAELSAEVGISERTLYRELSENEALARFVQRVERYVLTEGGSRRAMNRYRVCMDTPIYAADLAEYETLAGLRKEERDGREGEPAPKGDRQPASLAGWEKTARANLPKRTPQSAKNGAQPANLAEHKEMVSLPSGNLFTEENTPTAAPDPPAQRPPEGVGEQAGPDAAELRARAERELEAEGSVAWKLARAHAREGMIRAKVGEIVAAAGKSVKSVRSDEFG
jgi:AraC-like DNA-binding protein